MPPLLASGSVEEDLSFSADDEKLEISLLTPPTVTCCSNNSYIQDDDNDDVDFHRDERDEARSKALNPRESVEPKAHSENLASCPPVRRNANESVLEPLSRIGSKLPQPLSLEETPKPLIAAENSSHILPSVDHTPPSMKPGALRKSGVPCPSGKKKKVTFASVTLHYHSVGLGDSPSVSKGVPIAMMWDQLGTEIYSTLDLYEALRPNLQAKKNMRLKASTRRQILLRQGVSEEEIEYCIFLVEYLKEQSYENEYDDDVDGEDVVRSYHPYIQPQYRSGGCCANHHNNQDDLLSPVTWFDWVCR